MLFDNGIWDCPSNDNGYTMPLGDVGLCVCVCMGTETCTDNDKKKYKTCWRKASILSSIQMHEDIHTDMHIYAQIWLKF